MNHITIYHDLPSNEKRKNDNWKKVQSTVFSCIGWVSSPFRIPSMKNMIPETSGKSSGSKILYVEVAWDSTSEAEDSPCGNGFLPFCEIYCTP